MQGKILVQEKISKMKTLPYRGELKALLTTQYFGLNQIAE